jgi:predicted deacylase
MQTKTHPLISPALGTARHLTSFHYGPGGGQKIYIQSSLHADELPGMLVAWTLRRRLAELEAAGRLRGEVVVVPVSNPIGLNQRLLGQLLGRFETGTASNFNRHFHDLAGFVIPGIERHLTGDAQENLLVVRAALRDALASITPTTELESLRLALQRLSYDADVVLDLHCDFEAALHLYTNPALWPEVEPLARYLDAKASLFALNSMGNPFDEIHSFCWTELRARYGDRYPIPTGAVSVTIELRGQADVNYAYAGRDAQAIVDYLTLRGVIDGKPAPLPPLEFGPTPYSGAEELRAPASGVLVFRAPVGVRVEPGQPVADIVDPLTDRVVTVASSITGVLFARQRTRFATAGMVVGWVAGAEPLRHGALLPD